jgi:long-chain acyl-CoA synthetase
VSGLFAVEPIPHIREAMAAALARRPADAPAIWFGGAWYSWGELRDYFVQVERMLSAAGAGRDARIGLLARNRPAELAVLMGLLATSRPAIMINARLGEAALAHDVRARGLHAIIGARDVLMRADVAHAAAEDGITSIGLGDDLGQAIAYVPHVSRQGRSAPGVTAEILTSGTTGSPKPFAYTERMLAAVVPAIIASQSLMGDPPGPDQPPLIEFMPPSAVGGFCFAAISLYTGRPQIVHEKFSPQAFAAAARRFRPRMVGMNPALMRMVVNAGVAADDLASLRAVRSGSAPLDPVTHRAWVERYGIPILPVYGATEFGGPIASWTLDLLARFGAAKAGSVGRAWPGVEFRVIDAASGKIRPLGEVGLLSLRSDRMGSGWITTNDQASLDVDGFLSIQGRADDAINRGGNKILPEAVADVLRRHPDVLDAIVIGLPDDVLGEVPVAVVECLPGSGPVQPADLLDFARARLPAYQVPVELLVVDALPRTEFLKVSRPAARALFNE